MRKGLLKITTAVSCLLVTGSLKAQTDVAQVTQEIGYLIDDALFFSNQYITPATDAAVYQSSSGWITSPKKKKFGEVSFGIHTNIFFTPKRDQLFVIRNRDFNFFQLEEGNSAGVPTALGNDNQVYLSGTLGGSPLRMKTPEGMNMNTVAYPYLQGSVGLIGGAELVIKFSPHVKLKKSDYQVYGAGLKYNFSQYIKSFEEQKIHMAVLAGYSKEEVSFNFLDIKTDYGTLGINTITGTVDTYQFQYSASQEFGDLEFMASFIANVSDVKYKVEGETGSIEEIIPLQKILNNRLKEIYKTRINYIGEMSCKYNIGNFDVQTIVAFGKFVNMNVSLQYLFN